MVDSPATMNLGMIQMPWPSRLSPRIASHINLVFIFLKSPLLLSSFYF